MSRVSRDHSARLLVAFHKRRRERLEMSLDEPFAAERQPAPPVNVIQQALLVKAYMRANPEESCLSAAFKLNLNRKRIAKLLQIVDMLPKSFVKKAKNYTDPVILRRMSAGALSDILQFADPEQVARKLQKLVTLPSPDPQQCHQ